MTYTVIWKFAAERALTDIWTASTDREAVRYAADTIDADLRRDPYRIGESRSSNERIVFLPPLAVQYAVFDADRVVEVQSIWRVRGR